MMALNTNEENPAVSRIFSIVLCLVLIVFPLFTLGVMGQAEYASAGAVEITATLSGKTISGAQGGFTRYTTFTKIKSGHANATALAKNAPVFGAFAGGTVKFFTSDGKKNVTLDAKAVSASGESSELASVGNIVILPDEKGSYVIDVLVHTEYGDTQYAFNISVVPNTWSGSEIA